MPSWASCSLLGWNCLGTNPCREWMARSWQRTKGAQMEKKAWEVNRLGAGFIEGIRGSRQHASLGSLGEVPGRDLSASHMQQHLPQCPVVYSTISLQYQASQRWELSLHPSLCPQTLARAWQRIRTHLTFPDLNGIEGNWWNMFRARETPGRLRQANNLAQL